MELRGFKDKGDIGNEVQLEVEGSKAGTLISKSILR